MVLLVLDIVLLSCVCVHAACGCVCVSRHGVSTMSVVVDEAEGVVAMVTDADSGLASTGSGVVAIGTVEAWNEIGSKCPVAVVVVMVTE